MLIGALQVLQFDIMQLGDAAAWNFRILLTKFTIRGVFDFQNRLDFKSQNIKEDAEGFSVSH